MNILRGLTWGYSYSYGKPDATSAPEMPRPVGGASKKEFGLMWWNSCASAPADSFPCTAQGTLASFHREGVTILLVEQNVNLTLEIAHEAYILETGRITLQGRGRDLLKNPHIKKAYLGL